MSASKSSGLIPVECTVTKSSDITKNDIVVLRLKGSAFCGEYVELYGISFIISINQTDEEVMEVIEREWQGFQPAKFRKLLKNLAQKGPGNRAVHVFKKSMGLSLTRIFSCVSEPTHFNSIAHELVHSIHATLQHKGLSLTNSSEEAYAYLQGYMMDKLMEALLLPPGYCPPVPESDYELDYCI